jgi:hypothetical protein
MKRLDAASSAAVTARVWKEGMEVFSPDAGAEDDEF